MTQPFIDVQESTKAFPAQGPLLSLTFFHPKSGG